MIDTRQPNEALSQMLSRCLNEGLSIADRYAVALAFAAGDRDATLETLDSIVATDNAFELVATVAVILAQIVKSAVPREQLRELVREGAR